MQAEEIQHNAARTAIRGALEAARASYAEIREVWDGLNELESSGVYAPGYIEEQREQRAAAVRQSVEARLVGARQGVDNARRQVESRIEEWRQVSADQYAAATAQLQMAVGDRLHDNPEMLLSLYENLYDTPADRRAIEDLAGRLLAVLPEGTARISFEDRWSRLQESLSTRLPEEQRIERKALAELDRAREYVGDAETAVTSAIAGLTNPRDGGNLTAFSKALTYERELAGEGIIDMQLPNATPSGSAVGSAG